MIIDITNVRLDEVSKIMSKMDEMGMISRIERKDGKFLLVLKERREDRSVGSSISRSTLLDWCSQI
jgi:predicted transcriptional regulator of viral defense system